MAYQAKRKQLFTEDFELTEEDGAVIHTLHVALDPDNMAKKLSEKHMALVEAMQSISQIDVHKNPEQGLETLGNAVTDILEAVFGQEDTNTIVAFYDNRYVEMCQEVVPFITQVVVPRIREMARENKKQVAAGYKRFKFGKK